MSGYLLATIVLSLGASAAFATPDTSRGGEPRYDPSIRTPARLALVLSSGGLRGFAHVGVIRELRAHGIKPDLIVGTSVGAIVGAVAASGLSDAELAAAVDSTDRGVFMEWAKPQLGLLGGHAIHEFIDKNVKQHAIESFPLRFAAVALEADRACLQVFNAGDPGKAVQASATVPVLFSPPVIAGRYYLDGGLASPLPVRVARALGAQYVIAVDVTFDPADRPFVSITEALWRTSLVMKWALAVSERSDADFVIRPAFPLKIKSRFRHDACWWKRVHKPSAMIWRRFAKRFGKTPRRPPASPIRV